ncbi:MarR family transcriptional regulator [Rhodococcus sp. F64268]|uniref:MarR family winged helix-turn-helix transcriptional regulator n=1 Tax=Rhodococcus sp. F64268 TaxID=2926402 RepID=UPI001FF4A8C0|nr:MarR family transcriptional regulator [Rhodococcus sp. F64268]MCK0091340.1 MarR family transcriptional regulator [Rhodococcus sp. F64268]
MGRDNVPDHDAVDDIVSQWAREWPGLDVTPLEVLGRLHRTYLRYQGTIARIFDEYGINMASFDVLAALRRAGEPYRMTSGQLAESSLVTTGGVTLRIDRLEKAGLVRRERDADDRRIVHAELTEAGKKLIDEVAVAHFENETRMLAELSKDDQSELVQLLRKLEYSLARHQGA